jgi:hypothetical protein
MSQISEFDQSCSMTSEESPVTLSQGTRRFKRGTEQDPIDKQSLFKPVEFVPEIIDFSIETHEETILVSQNNIPTRKTLQSCSIYCMPNVIKELFPDLKQLREFDKFVIRRSYKSLGKILLTQLFPAAVSRYLFQLRNSTKHLSIIRGMEGIGKRTFLLYFLLIVISDARFCGESFAIENSSTNEVHLFFPVPGRRLSYRVSRNVAAAALGRVKCKLYLVLNQRTHENHYDKTLQTQRVRNTAANLTLIPSSCFLDEDDLIQFRSCYFKNGQINAYILPTWSFEELQFVNNFVPSWFLKYTLYGGIPALLFFAKSREDEQQRPYRQCKQDLTEQMNEGGLNIFYKMFARKYSHSEFNDDLLYYKIFHYNPQWNFEKNDWEYSSVPQITFASDEGFRLLNSSVSFDRILNYLSSNPTSRGFTEAMGSNMLFHSTFEQICLWSYPLVGKSVKVHPLPYKENEALINEVCELQIPSEYRKLSLDWKQSSCTRDVLYLPSISTQSDGMAFFLNSSGDNSELIIFKPTIFMRHSIDMDTVTEILSRFVEFQITKINFIFLIPEKSGLKQCQVLCSSPGALTYTIHQFICYYPQRSK